MKKRWVNVLVQVVAQLFVPQVRSSRPNGVGFPALVLDDPTLRHEELCDYMETVPL